MTVRFAVVTDGHWGDPPEGTSKTYQELHDDMLSRISTIHNNTPLDFVAHNGDIVHDDETLHQDVIDNFFSELPSGIDYEVAPGNHDWANDPEWNSYYGHDKQHTFEVGNCGFIITDTGDADVGTGTCADANWLETQIDGFADKDEIFVFNHIAPFTDTDIAGLDCPDVRTQLARDEVTATFLGHNHEKNIVEDNSGGTYAYCCRFGGYDPNATPYSIEKLGLRVVEVSE